MNQIIVNGFVNNFRHGMTKNDNAWCSFSIANSTYGGKDEDGNTRYNKSYFDVSAFEGLAEACIRVFDGNDDTPFLVQVTGTIEQREYTDNDGNQRKTYGIKAREVSRSGNISTFSNDAAPVPAAATGRADF